MPGTPVVIDRLWQGVSGQAPWQRKHGTVTAATNTRFDLRLGGAVKRQPTELVIDLVEHGNTALDDTGEYYFAAIRGAIIAIAQGGLTGFTEVIAWDEDGVPLDVFDSSGGTFDAYMASVVDINDDVDVTGSFDTMIVTNRNQDMGLVIQDAWTYDQMYNYLVSGDEDAGILFATDLTSNNTAAGEAIINFSALPDDADASNGEVYEVTLDEGFDPAGYYIYYEDESAPAYEDGYFPRHDNWYRIPRQMQAEARYDPAIMPHRIILDELNGRVILDQCPWRQRVSGRPATIKKMPWALLGVTTVNVNNFHIKSVEFFSGRLFLISEKNVTSSRSDDFFNLWVDNVGAITDSDRISDDVTQNDVGIVLRATVCGQAMLLMAENGQLEYSSGEAKLTNVNGRIRTITKFPSLDIAPASGPGLVTMIDQYDDVHQYQWAGPRDPSIQYTDMLTVHDPRRLENKTAKRIFQIGTTVFIVIDDGTVEVHDTFILQANTVQSAWCTFEFKDPAKYFTQWNTRINMVTQRDSSAGGFSLLTYIHRIQPVLAPDLFVPRMDRMELIPPGDMTYDIQTDLTTIPHTGRNGDIDNTSLVLRSSDGVGGFRRAVKLDDNLDPVFDGDLTADAQWLGFTFDWEIELSQLYARISGARETTMGLTIFYFDSTDFTIEWKQSPLATKTHEKSWQAHRVGVAIVGQPSLETSSLGVAMATDPRLAVVKIKSNSPGQVAIQALEYELQGQGRGKT